MLQLHFIMSLTNVSISLLPLLGRGHSIALPSCLPLGRGNIVGNTVRALHIRLSPDTYVTPGFMIRFGHTFAGTASLSRVCLGNGTQSWRAKRRCLDTRHTTATNRAEGTKAERKTNKYIRPCRRGNICAGPAPFSLFHAGHCFHIVKGIRAYCVCVYVLAVLPFLHFP